jgi:5'-deoxynucleotidase
MSSHFFAYLSRMKYINRWGLMRNTRSENLAEHSLQAAIIAHALCVINIKRLGGSLSPERAAAIALFHDAGEIITGDLPTPIKYNNPEIKSAYKSIESVAAQKLLSMLPDDLKGGYEGLFFESSRESELWKIIRAADKICAYIKCVEEEMAGNSEFKKAKEANLRAIKELGSKEADIFLDEFMPSFFLTLDEQE